MPQCGKNWREITKTTTRILIKERETKFMSSIDLEALLAPISEESPSGADLEYDPAFGELERTAQGKPEQVMGDDVIEAEDPDWRAVRDQAAALLAQTKDLRVAVHLAQSAMKLEELNGLADGLELIRGLVENFWDDLHPQLDAEDNNDPMMRVNSLLGLSDRNGFLARLLGIPLVKSRAAGIFSLRDVKIAKGELSPTAGAESAPADQSLIDAAFMDADLDEIQGSADAVERAIAALTAVEVFFVEKVGAVDSPDFGELPADLKAMKAVYDDALVRRGVGVAEAATAEEGGQPGAAPISGEISNRADAIRMLDKICDFFEKTEPSSPVPMLLRRAKRLVSKDFLEILRELTPDAVAQAKAIGGVKDDGTGEDGGGGSW